MINALFSCSVKVCMPHVIGVLKKYGDILTQGVHNLFPFNDYIISISNFVYIGTWTLLCEGVVSLRLRQGCRRAKCNLVI